MDMNLKTDKNLDKNELDHFESQAEKWWDPKGPMQPLHHLNPVRLQFITDRCLINSLNIVDIGCGGGILTESLAKRGANAVGIDASLKLINVAKLHAEQNNLKISYENILAESYAENNQNRFDIVTCMELIEHVPYPKSLIQACAKLLKPGGLVFFSTLNRTLKSYLAAIIGAEYLLRILPVGTHHYEKFIKPSELSEWFSECGLTLEDISGLHYNPLFKKAWLTQDVSVNYIVVARK